MSQAARNEMPLTPDQCQGLDQAAQCVDAARAELGEAYLRFEEARVAFERSEARLKSSAAQARHAEGQHRSILVGISKILQLPDGEWVYDPGKTRLVRKGSGDA